MEIIEWIIWTLLLLWSILGYFGGKKHLGKLNNEKKYSAGYLVGISSLAKISLITIMILLVFLIIDINKLHLLWIYPIIYLFITNKKAKNIIKKTKENK